MPPKNPGMRRSRLLSIREQLGGGNIGERTVSLIRGHLVI